MNPLLKRVLPVILVISFLVYFALYQGTSNPVVISKYTSTQDCARKDKTDYEMVLKNGTKCQCHIDRTANPNTSSTMTSYDKHTLTSTTAAANIFQRLFQPRPAQSKQTPVYTGPKGEAPLLIPGDTVHSNNTVYVLMLSYQRSGSSFMGNLLNMNPSVFYVYEPLDALYSSIYGIPPGWSVPSDITGNNDGSVRKLPDYEVNAAADTISKLMTCDLDNLPIEVLISQFWTQFWSNHRNILDFTKCLQRQRVNVGKCHNLYLRRYCSPRYGIIKHRDEKCRNILLNKRTADPSSPQGKYLKCLLKQKDMAKKCFPALKSRCVKSPIRGTKTVRATMQMASVLLDKHPNLKVLHLFRDPRPVMLSRLKHQSFRSYNAKKNIVIESKYYCNIVEHDIQLREELNKKYPNRLREIIYEDFISNPVLQAKAIYQFIGIRFSEDVEKWLVTNTKTSSSIAAAWETHLKENERVQMENNCKKLFEYGNNIWEPTHLI